MTDIQTYIKQQLLEQKISVSYSWLARSLGINLNESKKALEQFSKSNGSDFDVQYMITGELKPNMDDCNGVSKLVVKKVMEDSLPEFIDGLVEGFKKFVICIQPKDEDSMVPTLASPPTNPKLESVDQLKSLGYTYYPKLVIREPPSSHQQKFVSTPIKPEPKQVSSIPPSSTPTPPLSQPSEVKSDTKLSTFIKSEPKKTTSSKVKKPASSFFAPSNKASIKKEPAPEFSMLTQSEEVKKFLKGDPKPLNNSSKITKKEKVASKLETQTRAKKRIIISEDEDSDMNSEEEHIVVDDEHIELDYEPEKEPIKKEEEPLNLFNSDSDEDMEDKDDSTHLTAQIKLEQNDTGDCNVSAENSPAKKRKINKKSQPKLEFERVEAIPEPVGLTKEVPGLEMDDNGNFIFSKNTKPSAKLIPPKSVIQSQPQSQDDDISNSKKEPVFKVSKRKIKDLDGKVDTKSKQPSIMGFFKKA